MKHEMRHGKRMLKERKNATAANGAEAGSNNPSPAPIGITFTLSN